METISTLLNNRKEIITLEKLKSGVQRMLKKNFNIDYLQEIKTVFPAAYNYAWENVLGPYGNIIKSDFELHISVNFNYKRDTLKI